MRISFAGDWVAASAPAKLNLFLELLARRWDGYHELETLMVPVDLCDTLRLRATADPRICLRSRWATPSYQPEAQARDQAAAPGKNLGDIPSGPQNIVVRAVELLRTRAAISAGAEIELTKRIPSAAGLGGASSDAAAALVAANLAFGLNWSVEQLQPLALELGADVPFFLSTGPAICRGRGERIEGLSPLPRLDIVIVRPPEGLSTPAVYKQCRVPANPRTVAPFITAWSLGNCCELAAAMFNRLEEPAEQLSPWIARLRQAFQSLGCWAHQMTGSGSSYFGIARHTAHARHIAARLRALRLGHVIETHTLTCLANSWGGSQAA
jgi:4-diphosphocytidyl-2-C-methyl-D-erythritol kinase